MSGVALSSVWYLGPRISAQVGGLPFQQYRPLTSAIAISSANLIGTTPVLITADQTLMSMKPFVYGKPVGFAAVDPALTLPGDYLVGPLVYGEPNETFFIASQDIPAPIQVVRCNKVMSFARPNPNPPGGTYYGGDVRVQELPLMTAWPAALLQGTKGEKGPANLPGDTRMPWMILLVSAFAGVTLATADRAIDVATGDRYTISSAELTAQGWRVVCILTQT